jgi:hypothetical protein
MKAFDPEKLLKILAKHGVRYVLVGAIAARLQGFTRLTADADITPARDTNNLIRLSRALQAINARVYTESVPDGLAFDCSAETLGRAALWNLVTDAGRVDVIFEPVGTQGYGDLNRNAIAYEAYGVQVRASSLEDVLRSKESSNRPQDAQDALVIRELLRRAKKITK